MGIKVLSLFDGISCGHIALERAGIEIEYYYASEIDKYTIKVTQNKYPDTIQLGSVVDIVGRDLPKIDLLIGGSPCQGFSFMGKQLNLEDPRSRLFFQYVRILDELRIKNPDIKFLLENVKMAKQSQDIISSCLGVSPVLINSSLFSAQSRNRLYWTNIPIETITSNNTQVMKDIMDTTVDRKYYLSLQAVNGIIKSSFKDCKPINREEKCSCLLLSNNRKNSCNNYELYKEYEIRGNITEEELSTLDFRRLTPVEYERLQTVSDNYTIGLSDSQRYKALGNGWTVDVVSHIFKGLK